MAVGSKYKFVHKINAEAGDQTMLKRKKKKRILNQAGTI